MTRTCAWVVVLGWICAAAAASAANSGLPARPFDYALFGLKEVRLGMGTRVDVGDVGVNQEQGRVRLRARARVDGTIVAETIRLGTGARAVRLVATRVEGDERRSDFERLSGLPLVPTMTLVQVVPGTADKELPPNSQELGLPPGSYGSIRVGSRSRLTLAGGTYDVRSIDVRRSGQILCETPCIINVDDRVLLNESAQLGAVSPLDATAVQVNVEGGGRDRSAFRAESRTTVDATVYAPAGRIHLGPGGHFTGAFVGDTIEVLSRARVKAMPIPATP